MALITTTNGPMPEEALEKREGGHEDDNEVASWVEYWLAGELVHRSAHVHLKRGMFAAGLHTNFG